MSRSLRRGVFAASVLVISLASLSACAAGNDAATLSVKPDNAATAIGGIQVQNANIITQPDQADGPAVVTGKIFNNGTKAQTLDAIPLPGTDATVVLSPASGSGPVTVPPGGSVQLGGAGNASAVIENGREAVRDGDFQQVVFRFSETGDVALSALVLPARQYFTGVGPSALPTPPAEPTPTATGEEVGTPTDGSSDDGANGSTDEAADAPVTEGATDDIVTGDDETPVMPTDSASASFTPAG